MVTIGQCETYIKNRDALCRISNTADRSRGPGGSRLCQHAAADDCVTPKNRLSESCHRQVSRSQDRWPRPLARCPGARRSRRQRPPASSRLLRGPGRRRHRDWQSESCIGRPRDRDRVRSPGIPGKDEAHAGLQIRNGRGCSRRSPEAPQRYDARETSARASAPRRGGWTAAKAAGRRET